MFVVFMPLHILICDEVLPYFVLCEEVIHILNLNLNQKDLNLYEVEVKVNTLTQLTWPGLRILPYSGLTLLIQVITRR
jgi:hypothetical protein